MKGNISDRSTLEEAMAGHDAVVHFAAESHVDRSIVGPDDFVHTNCFGTNVVMDTARQLEIGRVIHIGTDEVYGSVEVGSSRETDPLEPRSPYSASKAGSDLIALSYHSTYGAAGQRHALHRTTSGPSSTPRRPSRCSRPTCSTASTIPLYGDGLQRARLALRRRPLRRRRTSCCTEGAAGEIYNIGAGNETPNRVLVDKLLALLGAGDEMVDLRRPTAWATTAATRSTSPRSPRWAGAGQRSLDEALDDDRGLVPRQPVVVGTAQGPMSEPRERPDRTRA